MRDNLRRYRAIRDAFTPGYPGQPTGTVARPCTTLAALISGMVGSKSTQLPSMATPVPDGNQPESRVKREARWLRNAQSIDDVYFLPSAAIWTSDGESSSRRDVLLLHDVWTTEVLQSKMDGV